MTKDTESLSDRFARIKAEAADLGYVLKREDEDDEHGGQPVSLIYTNWRGECQTRTITPVELWYGSTDWHSQDQWFIQAFDHAKGASRDFALKDFGYPASAIASVAEECAAHLENQAEALPVGHEMPTKGCSTYNWMKYAANQVRALIDQPSPERHRGSRASQDVLAERYRQVISEGFDGAHDDQNTDDELARAAICYILGNAGNWPTQWDRKWWKPADRRRNLVKAAALLVAEIERIDRLGDADDGEAQP